MTKYTNSRQNFKKTSKKLKKKHFFLLKFLLCSIKGSVHKFFFCKLQIRSWAFKILLRCILFRRVTLSTNIRNKTHYFLMENFKYLSQILLNHGHSQLVLQSTKMSIICYLGCFVTPMGSVFTLFYLILLIFDLFLKNRIFSGKT